MGSAKKILYTVATSFAAGVVIGILYAPDKGSKTRRKVGRLKKKVLFSEDGTVAHHDLETLEELSEALQEQLDKVNKRLDKE